MASLVCLASSPLPPEPVPYVYSTIPFAAHTAAILSDDSLQLYQHGATEMKPVKTIPKCHEGVTCLQAYDEESQVLVTAGRDGFVRGWDMRGGRKAFEVPKRKIMTPILLG